MNVNCVWLCIVRTNPVQIYGILLYVARSLTLFHHANSEKTSQSKLYLAFYAIIMRLFLSVCL